MKKIPTCPICKKSLPHTNELLFEMYCHGNDHVIKKYKINKKHYTLELYINNKWYMLQSIKNDSLGNTTITKQQDNSFYYDNQPIYVDSSYYHLKSGIKLLNRYAKLQAFL